MGSITKNISPTELACKCCGFINAQLELIDMLQKYADKVGRLRINCACRCPRHNKEVGGAKNSMHLLGIAADVTPLDSNFQYATAKALDLYNSGVIGGLIIYNDFIHMDCRRLKYYDNRQADVLVA